MVKSVKNEGKIDRLLPVLFRAVIVRSAIARSRVKQDRTYYRGWRDCLDRTSPKVVPVPNAYKDWSVGLHAFKDWVWTGSNRINI